MRMFDRKTVTPKPNHQAHIELTNDEARKIWVDINKPEVVRAMCSTTHNLLYNLTAPIFKEPIPEEKPERTLAPGFYVYVLGTGEVHALRDSEESIADSARFFRYECIYFVVE